MERFHAKRLAKLANHMKTIEADTFNIDTWIDGQSINSNKIWMAKIEEHQFVTNNQINVCGTTACLLGHAAAMPEFRKRGLKLFVSAIKHNGNQGQIYGNVHLYDEHTNRQLTTSSFESGMIFFGLTQQESYDLFSNDGYTHFPVKPKHCVALIKKIIKTHDYKDIADTI